MRRPVVSCQFWSVPFSTSTVWCPPTLKIVLSPLVHVLFNAYNEVHNKGALDKYNIIPKLFSKKSWDFHTIRSVDMSNDCMLSFTLSIDVLLKKYEYFGLRGEVVVGLVWDRGFGRGAFCRHCSSTYMQNMWWDMLWRVGQGACRLVVTMLTTFTMQTTLPWLQMVWQMWLSSWGLGSGWGVSCWVYALMSARQRSWP